MKNIEIINRSIKDIENTIMILKKHLLNERLSVDLKKETEDQILTLIQTRDLLKLTRTPLQEKENSL